MFEVSERSIVITIKIMYFFKNGIFIKFARGTLIVLSSIFKIFVSMGPVAFLRFNAFIKGCTSLGSIGARKKVFWRGFLRKSENFLCVWTILLSIILAIVVKNLLKLLLITNGLLQLLTDHLL